MAPQHEPFEPTQAIPISRGFLGNYNAMIVNRNFAFAAWLESLYDAVWDAGIKILIDHRQGGTNGKHTLTDFAWILLPDGRRMLCSLGIMDTVKNPVNWIKTKISDVTPEPEE